jgi:hypothetical protein
MPSVAEQGDGADGVMVAAGQRSGRRCDEGETTDPHLNFTGRTSSYSGEPIPLEEMCEWADATSRVSCLQHSGC